MLYLRDEMVSWLWFWSSRIQNSRSLYVHVSVGNINVLHYTLCLLTGNDLSIRVTMKERVRIYHAIGIVVGSGTVFEPV